MPHVKRRMGYDVLHRMGGKSFSKIGSPDNEPTQSGDLSDCQQTPCRNDSCRPSMEAGCLRDVSHVRTIL